MLRAATDTVMPRLDIALAAAATVVALAFALFELDRWLRRRRPQELAWTVAMALFALATGAMWYGFSRGWSGPSFRVFYVAGGVLNVPWLAAGSVALMSRARTSRRLFHVLLFVSGLCVGVVCAAPMRRAVTPYGLPKGRDLFGALPRVFAAVGSGVAAVVIIVVALWSAAQSWRKPQSGARRRALGNIVIAVGTVMLSSAGTLNARLGESRAFAVTTLIGVVVLFAGVWIGSWRPAPQPPQGPHPPALRYNS